MHSCLLFLAMVTTMVITYLLLPPHVLKEHMFTAATFLRRSESHVCSSLVSGALA